MARRSIAAVLMAAILVLGSVLAAGAAAQSFDLNTFTGKVRERIGWTGGRDTWLSRVPKGESCVQASEARAREIAFVVKSMQFNGQFGDYGARIGTVSGWNPGIGSLHTYTVVEIIDSSGRVVHTLDVDNYMGPVYISAHSRVNWNSNYSNLIEKVAPAKPVAAKPTTGWKPQPKSKPSPTTTLARPAPKPKPRPVAKPKSTKPTEAQILAEFRSLYPRFLQATKSPGNRVEVVKAAVKVGANKYHVFSKTYCIAQHGVKKGQYYKCASYEGYWNLGQVEAAVKSYKKKLGIK